MLLLLSAVAWGCASLAGLSGGGEDGGVPSDAHGSDATRATSRDAGADVARARDATGAVDAPKGKDATNATDAHAGGDTGTTVGTDAAVSPWGLVSSIAVSSVSSSDLVSSATTGIPVQVGDLVIFACDLACASGSITIVKPPGVFSTYQQIGPVQANGCMDVAAFGIVENVPDAGTVTMTAAAPSGASWEDCTIDVFRDGSPTPKLVDQIMTTGNLGGAAGTEVCGPVKTAKDGLAFYVVYMSGGANNTPENTAWTGLQNPFGNPDGYDPLTDGGPTSTALMATGSQWTCLTFSLSP